MLSFSLSFSLSLDLSFDFFGPLRFFCGDRRLPPGYTLMGLSSFMECCVFIFFLEMVSISDPREGPLDGDLTFSRALIVLETFLLTLLILP